MSGYRGGFNQGGGGVKRPDGGTYSSSSGGGSVATVQNRISRSTNTGRGHTWRVGISTARGS